MSLYFDTGRIVENSKVKRQLLMVDHYWDRKITQVSSVDRKSCLLHTAVIHPEFEQISLMGSWVLKIDPLMLKIEQKIKM